MKKVFMFLFLLVFLSVPSVYAVPMTLSYKGIVTESDGVSLKIVPSDGAAYDFFGYAVSLSGDYAIVGAYNDDSGSAYIYKKEGNSWILQSKILADDGASDDVFGYAVSLSGDYAIVGAFLDDDKGTDSGSAYIYKREGNSWNLQSKIFASNGADSDHFGCAVSLSGDYAIVRATYDDKGIDFGSVYIYKREGNSWIFQSKILANDAAAYDCFGCAVSLSGDYAIVGAYNDDDKGTDSGSVYIYKREGNSWIFQVKIIADDGAGYDYFGRAVSLSGDYAIVGAESDDDKGAYSGSAYIYKREGNSWILQSKILANDGAAYDWFGGSVSISNDYAVVGTYSSGAAYVFRQDGKNWKQITKLHASDAGLNNRFGHAVSVSGSNVLVGAYRDDDKGTGSGSAYMYTLKSGIELSMENQSSYNGKTLSVPIKLKNTDIPILGMEIVISYNPAILHVKEIVPKTELLGNSYQFMANPIYETGKLYFSITAITENLLILNDVIATISFDVIGNAGSKCSLSFDLTEINAGRIIVSNVLNAEITIEGPTLISLSVSKYSTITIGISLSDEMSIEGMGIMMEYDPEMLQFIDATLSDGILSGRHYDLSVSPYNNEIYLGIRATQNLYTGTGAVAFMNFIPKKTAKGSTKLILKSFDCNETEVSGVFTHEGKTGDEVVIDIPESPQIRDVLEFLKKLSGM